MGVVAFTALAVGCTAAGGARPGPAEANAVRPASHTAAASCLTQFDAWRNDGGSGEINAVGADLRRFTADGKAFQAGLDGGNPAASAEAALQTAAASLQSDAQTAETDLPPSCVPGMRPALRSAFNGLTTAAISYGQAVTEASSGNYTTAGDDMDAGNTAMAAAVKEINAAAQDTQVPGAGG